MPARKKVALIGASTRAIYAFADPLVKDYRDTHEIVGCFDINPHRIGVMSDFIAAQVPAFDHIDAMFRQTRPDLVIISTVDATHAAYIEKAFEYEVDCVSEKPLCTTAEQCRRLREVQAARPHVQAFTSHNYRYVPFALRIKRIVDSGKLGRLRSLIFHEQLDQRHGASYFRRWNREKKNSGGLLVHKASHCFDLMNWWVGSRPKEVMARGSLTAYGPGASPFRGEACHRCPHAEACPQYDDANKDHVLSRLYFEGARPGAYTPDLCVFAPEIDAEDHATVGYSYENGVQVTFDLRAYAAYEGVHIVVEGSDGRLEFREGMSTRWMLASGQHGLEETTGKSLRFCGFEQPVEELDIEGASGGHGGADPMMLDDTFGPPPHSNVRASLEDGIQAVLIGAAANISIAERRTVDAQALLAGAG